MNAQKSCSENFHLRYKKKEKIIPHNWFSGRYQNLYINLLERSIDYLGLRKIRFLLEPVSIKYLPATKEIPVEITENWLISCVLCEVKALPALP